VTDCIIEDAKVRDYLLNLDHEDGGPKAKFFIAGGSRETNRLHLWLRSAGTFSKTRRPEGRPTTLEASALQSTRPDCSGRSRANGANGLDD